MMTVLNIQTEPLRISAKSGIGIDKVVQRIIDVARQPEVPDLKLEVKFFLKSLFNNFQIFIIYENSLLLFQNCFYIMHNLYFKFQIFYIDFINLHAKNDFNKNR